MLCYVLFAIHGTLYIGVCSGILANSVSDSLYCYLMCACDLRVQICTFVSISNKNMRTWQNISPSRTQYLDREMTEILQVYTLDT